MSYLNLPVLHSGAKGVAKKVRLLGGFRGLGNYGSRVWVLGG